MGTFKKLLTDLASEGVDEYYRLTPESTFLDIGHGKGTCVY